MNKKVQDNRSSSRQKRRGPGRPKGSKNKKPLETAKAKRGHKTLVMEKVPCRCSGGKAPTSKGTPEKFLEAFLQMLLDPKGLQQETPTACPAPSKGAEPQARDQGDIHDQIDKAMAGARALTRLSPTQKSREAMLEAINPVWRLLDSIEKTGNLVDNRVLVALNDWVCQYADSLPAGHHDRGQASNFLTASGRAANGILRRFSLEGTPSPAKLDQLEAQPNLTGNASIASRRVRQLMAGYSDEAVVWLLSPAGQNGLNGIMRWGVGRDHKDIKGLLSKLSVSQENLMEVVADLSANLAGRFTGTFEEIQRQRGDIQRKLDGAEGRMRRLDSLTHVIQNVLTGMNARFQSTGAPGAVLSCGQQCQQSPDASSNVKVKVSEQLLDPFWVVWNPRRGQPTVKHQDFMGAMGEAGRLAGKEGMPFYVLRSMLEIKVEAE